MQPAPRSPAWAPLCLLPGREAWRRLLCGSPARSMLSSTRVDTRAGASEGRLNLPVRCRLPLSTPSLEPAHMHTHDQSRGASGQARTQTPCPARHRRPKGWNYCPAFRKGAI